MPFSAEHPPASGAISNVRLKKGQIYPASVLFTETPCCDGDVLQNTVSFSGPILVKRDNEQQWHAAPYSINFTYTMPNASVSTISTLYSASVAVPKVEFTNSVPCSGFDATVNPPWIMAPKDGNNTAIAEINPAAVANQINFASADPGKATVAPATASTSPQTITVSGVAKGETEIRAKVASSTIATLNVSVKVRTNVTVAIHAITEENDDVQVIQPGTTAGTNQVCVTAGPNGFLDSVKGGDDQIVGNSITTGTNAVCETTANHVNIPPTHVPTADELRDYLNEVYGKQANVFFTVSRTDTNINYDLDRNGKMADPEFVSATWAEADAISRVAKNSNVNINMYFVHAVEVPVAFTEPGRKEGWIGDEHSRSTLNVAAHEIGHALGADHSSDPNDLMFGGDPIPSPYSNDPCRLTRQDWNAVNKN